jgi:hypothetical protein
MGTDKSQTFKGRGDGMMGGSMLATPIIVMALTVEKAIRIQKR